MKNLLVIASLLVWSMSVNAQTIVGTWKTIDHESGKTKSLVKIYKAKNGKYYGKIIKLFQFAPNIPKNPKCIKCSKKDYRYNQPIIGMAILTKLKASKDLKSASGGKVLNPEDGKSYDCKISVTKDGKKLKMRGYIGIPAIGETQTWIRVK